MLQAFAFSIHNKEPFCLLIFGCVALDVLAIRGLVEENRLKRCLEGRLLGGRATPGVWRCLLVRKGSKNGYLRGKKKLVKLNDDCDECDSLSIGHPTLSCLSNLTRDQG